MDLPTRVTRQFESLFGVPPAALVRAPGRVNLIGEHTDYNDGFVLPMAIDRAIWIALRSAAKGQVQVASLDYGETLSFSLEDLDRPGEEGWLEYLKGTAWALQQAGLPLAGWQGVLAGDVPIGAGLSSSAAFEMAAARAFVHLSGLAWEPERMARLGQRAENAWVGVNCGIMDQMISARGRAGHALLLDCRSLEGQHVPLPAGCAVAVLDTGTRRGLVGSAYNDRRAQCEAVAARCRVAALRDVTLEALQARAGDLDEEALRRARHVVSENERTLAAAHAMRAGDAVTLGRLMDASHSSLRDDFEVSSPALDAMVTAARAHGDCLGARMTGAGFGGCAVALVRAAAADDFVRQTASHYAGATGHEPSIYVCQATDGAAVVWDTA